MSWVIAQTTWLSCTIQPSCFYSLAFLWQEGCELVLSLLGEKKKCYRHLSWSLEVWTLDPVGVLECCRGCRSSRTAMLDNLLQDLGGFVSILESCSKVSNSAWELRRICVPFWAVCGSKSRVSSLASALFPFLSFTGFRVKSGLLMQNKSCVF